MSAAIPADRPLESLPLAPAWVRADQAAAFTALVRADAPESERPNAAFASFTAMVAPFALAVLARPFDDDEAAIAVLDEAQFSGRYVSLTPRPDCGFSLALDHRRDG